MITETQLYKLVKKCLPDEYDLKLRFSHARTTNNISVGKNKMLTNTLSVYFKPAFKPIRNASGKYVVNSKRIIFNLYTDVSCEQSINDGYEILGKIRDNMIELKNSTVDIGTSGHEYIRIIDSEIGIDTGYIGMTEQGQAFFSMEIILKY